MTASTRTRNQMKSSMMPKSSACSDVAVDAPTSAPHLSSGFPYANESIGFLGMLVERHAATPICGFRRRSFDACLSNHRR